MNAFNKQRINSSDQSTGAMIEDTSDVKTLLKVLDGQECLLESKYEGVFLKTRNIPVIMMANQLPYTLYLKSVFKSRYNILKFSTII
jgi:hypothetical protein